MTRAQKQAIATVLLSQAGNIVENLREGNTGYMQELEDLNPDDVAAQLSVWLKNLPGTEWDIRLPQP